MTYASTILADSPIGYWRLGEAAGTTADNAEGTAALDGTYVNTPTLGVAGALNGDADTAVDFDYSASEHVTVPDSAALDFGNGPVSYEAWVKVSSAQAAMILTKGDQTPTLRILVDGQILWNALNWSSCSSSGTYKITDTNWHHIVGTKSAANVWLVYLDGADVTTVVTLGIDTVSTATDLFIGASPIPDITWAGSLDEVAIYGSVLSAAQIAAHYAAGTGATPTWTTPADTTGMSTTPQLQFTSPTSAVAQHFQLQLDTSPGFASGALRTYDSNADQTNWTYWNGSAWTALPAGGLAAGYSGNEVRYTVTSALSASLWYRRVRAGE